MRSVESLPDRGSRQHKLLYFIIHMHCIVSRAYTVFVNIDSWQKKAGVLPWRIAQNLTASIGLTLFLSCDRKCATTSCGNVLRHSVLHVLSYLDGVTANGYDLKLLLFNQRFNCQH